MLGKIARKISVTGIFAGFGVAYLTDVVLSLPFMISAIKGIDFYAIPRDQIREIYINAIYGNSYVIALLTLISCLASVMGGYMAAKIAKHDEPFNGALSTLPLMTLQIFSLTTGKLYGPLWMHIALLAAVPFFGLLGATLRVTKNQDAIRARDEIRTLAISPYAIPIPASDRNFGRDLLTNILSGLKALFFCRQPTQIWRASIGQLSLLLVLVMLINCGAEYFEGGVGSTFYLKGLPRLYAIVAIIVAAALPSAFVRRGYINNLLLPTMLASLLVVYDLLVRPVPWIFYDLGWLKAVRFASVVYLFYYLLVFWLLLAFLVSAKRVLKPMTRSGYAVLVFYALVMSVGLYYFPARGVWTKPYKDESIKFSAEDQRRQELLYSGDLFQLEPDIFRKAVDALQATQDDRTNMYFVGVAPYGYQDVFMKEVEAIDGLFAKNFGTEGRSLLLINNVHTVDTVPLATEANVRQALKEVGQRMKKDNDLLVLYLTSHGSKEEGLAMYLEPFQMKSLRPAALKSMLDDAGIVWRVIIVSGCYSGIFVEPLKNDHTIIMTASDSNHTSYGCSDEGDMTDFPKALIVNHLVKSHDFMTSFDLAKYDIENDEKKMGIEASHPQMYVGPEMLKKLQAFRLQNSTDK
jgi:hypothetical protein